MSFKYVSVSKFVGEKKEQSLELKKKPGVSTFLLLNFFFIFKEYLNFVTPKIFFNIFDA